MAAMFGGVSVDRRLRCIVANDAATRKTLENWDQKWKDPTRLRKSTWKKEVYPSCVTWMGHELPARGISAQSPRNAIFRDCHMGYAAPNTPTWEKGEFSSSLKLPEVHLSLGDTAASLTVSFHGNLPLMCKRIKDVSCGRAMMNLQLRTSAEIVSGCGPQRPPQVTVWGHCIAILFFLQLLHRFPPLQCHAHVTSSPKELMTDSNRFPSDHGSTGADHGLEPMLCFSGDTCEGKALIILYTAVCVTSPPCFPTAPLLLGEIIQPSKMVFLPSKYLTSQ
ncbi:hypothetical protein Tco_1243363 [Tanacetum coccineum]